MLEVFTVAAKMIRSQGRLLPMPPAKLTWSEADEPRSTSYGDYYFSPQCGDEETAHVFIEGNALGDRVKTHSRPTFVIGELGFGTGLSFLLTCQWFLEHAPASLRLHYWTVERHPLAAQDLRRALARWPRLQPAVDALCEMYPPPFAGVHRRRLAGGRITVDFVWADAEQALEDLAGRNEPCVDAWYLDGFAPSRNASMWSESLLRCVAAASHDDATVATYTVAAAVREALTATGFAFARRPGVGKKRENLSARRISLADARAGKPTSNPLTPWDLPRAPHRRPTRRIVVLGAGLAGAHVAAALASRGLDVLVLEASTRAGRASGNEQGVLFTRLSHQRSTLLDFSLLAFSYARTVYQGLFRDGSLTPEVDGTLNGCFQALESKALNPAMLETLAAFPGLAQSKSALEASRLIGSTPASGGIWQPGSGWLAPPAVCAALLDHPRIQLREHCGAVSLQAIDAGEWRAMDQAGVSLAEADTVVIAQGSLSRNLFCTRDLPLKVVRGQTTQVPAPAEATLQAAFCHKGYLAPAVAGMHCIGATFAPDDEDRGLRASDNAANIEALAHALPEWAVHLESLDPARLTGRAELRCVSPDYLPMVGPVPRSADFRHSYAPLGHDAKQVLDERGSYYPGLYLSTAMGSRGLSYAALSAEVLASQIAAEPAPLSRELQRAIAPARFLMRGIMRAQQPIKSP